jgi:hypothetical protein
VLQGADEQDALERQCQPLARVNRVDLIARAFVLVIAAAALQHAAIAFLVLSGARR